MQVGGNIALPKVDLCLCNKTNLEELAQIISGAQTFIGGEGAPAHLSGFIGQKNIVLYGPNKPEFLAYPNTKTLFSNSCTTCIWVTKNWRSACPLDYKIAPCMQNIKPQQVLKAVKELL